MSEADLADPDSRFKVLNEVAVHYKVANGAAGGAPKLAVAMYHVGNPRMLDASQRALSHIPTTIIFIYYLAQGFGANTFSWSFVDKLLAEDLQALVTSHDMPGFGLTQR